MSPNDSEVLIGKAQQLLEMATLLLIEARQQAGFDQNLLLSTRERVHMLEQRADHEHDGLSFADTLGGEQ